MKTETEQALKRVAERIDESYAGQVKRFGTTMHTERTMADLSRIGGIQSGLRIARLFVELTKAEFDAEQGE